MGIKAPDRNIKGVNVKLDMVVAISLFFETPAINPPIDKTEKVPKRIKNKRAKRFPLISSP